VSREYFSSTDVSHRKANQTTTRPGTVLPAPARRLRCFSSLSVIDERKTSPMAKRNKTKTPAFKAGLFFLSVFCLAMGALGVYGWTQSDMDLTTRVMTSFGAGATALVIPFTVIAIGRAWASIGVLPVLALCMGMQAVSFHNFFNVVIEAPHKAAFDASLLPLTAEVTRTTDRLDAAQAALDAVEAPALPERCKQVACPNTIEANAKAYALALEPRQKALDTAKADRQNALEALAQAQTAYHPMAPDLAIWIVGGLLDISIALAIWSLEATGRKLRKDATVERAKVKRPKRKPAAKKPVKGFKPYVVASNP